MINSPEQGRSNWQVPFINDEIAYFREMTGYLLDIGQINPAQKSRQDQQIDGWEERSRHQLEGGINFAGIRGRVRKTGNTLLKRFIRANIRQFFRKTGVSLNDGIHDNVHDGNFYIEVGLPGISSAAESIASFIQDPDTRVRHIRSWGAGLENDGIAKIAAAIQSPTCSLTELAIQNDRAFGGGGITTEGGLAIAEGLSSETCRIKTLSLAYNQIGELGASAIARAISLPHSQVRELDLGGTYLKDECASALGEAIKYSNLVVLNLWGSSFGVNGVDGVEEIARAIETPGNQLRQITMGMHFGKYLDPGTSIEEARRAIEESRRANEEPKRQGIKTFLDSVHNPNSLIENLSLSDIKIGKENLPDIVNLILDPNSKVRRMILNVTEFGDEEVKVIIEALSNPDTRIQGIDLRLSNITASYRQTLRQLKKEGLDIGPGLRIHF